MIYCRNFSLFSNQTSCYKIMCIRIVHYTFAIDFTASVHNVRVSMKFQTKVLMRNSITIFVIIPFVVGAMKQRMVNTTSFIATNIETSVTIL